MTFTIQYKPLFQVNILHKYFLNRGENEYFTMSENDKIKQLDKYDFNTFFSVYPTTETQKKLNGYNLVFKPLNSTFTVWSKVTGTNKNKPFIAFDNDLSFTFLVKPKESAFFNYSNLKLENAGKIYYFSNRKPASEPGTFRLINLAGNTNCVNQKYVLSENSIKAELDKLTVSEKVNLFGIIRIYIKADKPVQHITNSLGRIKNPHKIFELLFDNRKTTWRYIFDSDQSCNGTDDVIKEAGNAKILITKKVQPLTQNGFVSIQLNGEELPNPDARLIKPDTSSSKYYSEIYM